MRSRWPLASALAGCFALGWGAHAVTAQRRTPVSVTRLYTGSDGETHAEEIADTRLTPDAARSGLEASDVIRVSGLQFARTVPGWVRDWHVAERHQYIVTLSGRGEIELAGGRKIPSEPGSHPRRRFNGEGSHLTYHWNRRPHRIEHPAYGSIAPDGVRLRNVIRG